VRIPRGTTALLGTLALLCAASCGVRGKDQEQVLNRRLDGEPKTLNVLTATSGPEWDVLSLLTRNLLDYDEKLNLIPGLAESVEPDAGWLAFTVRLRDARWEDGSPVTSADVAYTIEALMDPKTPSLSRRSFFESFEKVEIVDARTARVFFKTPYSGRRDAFSVPLLPAKEYKGTDINTNPRNRNPLANGPYRLARWDSGRSLELVRNTQYFGEKTPAERVVFRVVPESASAFQGLLVGSLDETKLTFDQRKKLDADPNALAASLIYPELGYTYIAWNNRSPLFSDPKIRVALTKLIDREAIAKALYGGTARPANGPVPPGLWSYDAALQPWPHDEAGAVAALEAAGWKAGADGVRVKDGKRFEFELTFGIGSDVQRQQSELIQQAFRKAGIVATLRPMEWGAFLTKSDSGELEASMLALNLDPNPDLAMNWHSTQVPPNGFNSGYYSNPKADALMDEIRTTFDRAKAQTLYKELQRILHEDEPVTFLHVVAAKWGVAKRVENVKASPMGLFIFWPGGSAWRVRSKGPAGG